MNANRCFRFGAALFTAYALSVYPLRVFRAAAQEPQPTKTSPADPEQGKILFEQNCSVCHGVDAGGEDGPDLHGIPESLGDATVQNIIRRGIPGTAMPNSFNLTEKDAANIVAYLRKLDSTAPSEATIGDPRKGEVLYNSSGCSTCHIIAGQGGNIGPDLTRIGAMRGPSNLKARLQDPGANLPKAGNGFYGAKWTQYLVYRAVEKDGRAVDGMRVGEDSFTIVLKDATGKFHGFRKPELRSLEKEPGKTFMPSFKAAFSGSQLDDLVAYLTSLKSSQ